MKKFLFQNTIIVKLTAIAFLNMLTVFCTLAQSPSGIKNIVLVHGAFVDSSGWEPVYKIRE